MKRSDMTCSLCIKFFDGFCRQFPQPYYVPAPDAHWCSQGRWHQWSATYMEMEPYYWGEWEEIVQ